MCWISYGSPVYVINLDAEDGEIRIAAVLRPGNQLDGSYTSRSITGRFSAQRR